MKRLFFLAILLALATGASAQTRSVMTGIYTAAQADRGLQLFATNCAKCYELGLTSSATIPPLGGEDFQSDFAGQSIADMWTRIQNTMPADNPGKLTPAETTDLIAFVLQNNHVPAGTTELPADNALQAQLKLEFPKR
jgi:cytochrome c